ncbi:MAG: penicillin-binding transpeptidase domain-containing protein [Solirubrobacteraceae bacterium]
MLDGGILVARRPGPARRRARRRRLLTRTVPIVVVAVAAFTVGVVLATEPGNEARQTVKRYVNDWEAGDVPAMYALLDPASQARVSEPRFAAELAAVADTATATSLRVTKVGNLHGDELPVKLRIHTRVWGTLEETLLVSVRGTGSDPRIHLSDQLLFPGLRAGEQLSRTITMPPRGTLLAADGTPLAEGPERSSPIPTVAAQIVGTLGTIPRSRAAAYAAEGYPPGAQVGQDGLEYIFQKRLAGRFGGELLAGRRVLATADAVGARPVKTTIVPSLELAALDSLGGQYAGMTVMDPRTGALEALVGIAFSASQPPGSTMKIITSTAALAAGIVTPNTTFPIQTSSDVGGYILQNAGGEACGGTLVNAFAVSCNSVFAPLGVRLGGPALVAMAERFGFDRRTSIPGALESTIPPADQIGDATAVGSSAIGQGKVLATPLEMADVAATIAMGGRRPIPTLLADRRPRFVTVTTPKIADEVQQMMIAVVEFGTGTAAQIPGVTVAGKTGTAELVDTANPDNPNASAPSNTDAWFVGYAPVGHPTVVAGALFPNQGAGGATAAPAVRQVLVAALGAG